MHLLAFTKAARAFAFWCLRRTLLGRLVVALLDFRSAIGGSSPAAGSTPVGRARAGRGGPPDCTGAANATTAPSVRSAATPERRKRSVRLAIGGSWARRTSLHPSGGGRGAAGSAPWVDAAGARPASREHEVPRVVREQAGRACGALPGLDERRADSCAAAARPSASAAAAAATRRARPRAAAPSPSSLAQTSAGSVAAGSCQSQSASDGPRTPRPPRRRRLLPAREARATNAERSAEPDDAELGEGLELERVRVRRAGEGMRLGDVRAVPAAAPPPTTGWSRPSWMRSRQSAARPWPREVDEPARFRESGAGAAKRAARGLARAHRASTASARRRRARPGAAARRKSAAD